MGTTNPYLLLGIALLVGAVPILFGVTTAYLKVSIVLGMLRSGLGGQQVPGQLVTSAVAVALTCVIMGPTIEATGGRLAAVDWRAGARDPIGVGSAALRSAAEPWREFLGRHAGAREVAVLSRRGAAAGDGAEPGLTVLAGAFVLSELKEAFVMAFVLLVPFVVIDFIVANILVGMGMVMVSPAIIALPLKLIVFVAADGWLVLAEALVRSYGGG
jgi:type III secretory pathway component EscR